MDLVDKEHIVGLEICQQRGQVARLGDHRPAGCAKADAQFLGDDLRQRGLAETGRAEKQHMVHRLAAALGSLDEHAQILARGLLPDKFGKALWAQRRIGVFGLALGRMEGNGFGHTAPIPSC